MVTVTKFEKTYLEHCKTTVRGFHAKFYGLVNNRIQMYFFKEYSFLETGSAAAFEKFEWKSLINL